MIALMSYDMCYEITFLLPYYFVDIFIDRRWGGIGTIPLHRKTKALPPFICMSA
jgi:hypothetical protein